MMNSSSNSSLDIGFGNVSIEDVVQVARAFRKVADLSDQALEKVERSSNWVEEAVRGIEMSRASGGNVKMYYGINTGFGG